MAERGLLVGLNVCNLGAHHVRLFAVFVLVSASANPVFAFDNQARKLAVGFEGQVLEQRELIQDVGLDGLAELRARQRLLQNFGEQLTECRVFGRAGLFAILAIKQIDVDGLADEVADILLLNSEKRWLRKTS